MPSQASARASDRTVATNRRARHDYEVLETVEAGLGLRGTEVKSLRAGQGTVVSPAVRRGGGDRFRRGSVRSRLRLEVSLPSLNRENGIAADNQLALAA